MTYSLDGAIFISTSQQFFLHVVLLYDDVFFFILILDL